MDVVMISSREADIAYLESMNEIELFGDSNYIDFFCEDGETNIGSAIVDKIRSLVEKIKKFFTDLFDKIASGSLKSKADAAMKKDKALAAKKVEVLDSKKIGNFSKKYTEKIKNAKSMEELDKIMAEYNTKKKIGFGVGAAVTVGLAVLCGKVLVPKYKEEQQKIIDNLNNEVGDTYEKYQASVKECDDAINKAQKLKDTFSKYHKLTDAQASKLRSAEKDAMIAKKNKEKSGKAMDDAINARDHHAALSKKELSQERLRCIGMIVSDTMNAVKNSTLSKYNAIKTGISETVANAKQAHAAKKAAEVEVHSESAEADLLGFADGYDFFEESAVDGAGKIAKAIGEFIDKLIQKLREFVQKVKDKAEVAKTKAILNSNLAKSKIMVKFGFHDKDIVKAVDGYYKLLNQSIIAMEKLTQKLKAGKINMDEFYAAGDKIDAEFDKQLSLLKKTYYSQKADARVESNAYEAMKIREYLIKLESYQTKKITEIHESANKALNKIREDARKVAEAEAAAAAEKAQAAKAAERTKKVIAAVVSTIALTATVGIFATRLKRKSSGSSDFKEFSESVDELTESMTLEEFTEAAMI